MAVRLTLDKLRRTVQINLGYGAVNLELLTEHIDRGIESAYECLARYYPMHGWYAFSYNYSVQKYKIPVSNMVGVLNLEFGNSGSRLEEAPYYLRWVDRMIELGDMYDAQKWFNDAIEWEVLPEMNTADPPEEEWWVYIHTTQSTFIDTFARLPNFCSCQFAWYIEPSDDPNIGVGRTRVDMYQWVKAYATAATRVILGDIRGKFGGIPGPNEGEILQMDGASQVERAESRMEKLEEDISERRRQLPMIVD